MSQLVVVDTSIFINYLRGESNDDLAILVVKNKVLLSQVRGSGLYGGIPDLMIISNALRH